MYSSLLTIAAFAATAFALPNPNPVAEAAPQQTGLDNCALGQTGGYCTAQFTGPKCGGTPVPDPLKESYYGETRGINPKAHSVNLGEASWYGYSGQYDPDRDLCNGKKLSPNVLPAGCINLDTQLSARIKCIALS